MSEEKRGSWCWKLALAWMWLAGCALGCAGSGHTVPRDLHSRPDLGWDAADTRPSSAAASDSRARESGVGFFGRFGEKRDSFQLLQEAAGLEEDAWHAARETLERGEAKELWEKLAHTRATLQNFAPRRALVFLLRQMFAAGEDVSYDALLEHTDRFRFLVVMRPDGYLAAALNGRPLQQMGRLEVREGRLMAGRFEVGAFYWDKGGVFYAVDEELRRLPAALMGELGLSARWWRFFSTTSVKRALRASRSSSRHRCPEE